MLFRLDSEKLSGTTTYYIIFMPQLILAEYIYILVLCPYDARLNQNSYVNNYFINLLKINNKNK